MFSMLPFVLVFHSFSLCLEPLIKAHEYTYNKKNPLRVLYLYTYLIPMLPSPPSQMYSPTFCFCLPPLAFPPPLCLSLPRYDVTVTAV